MVESEGGAVTFLFMDGLSLGRFIDSIYDRLSAEDKR